MTILPKIASISLRILPILVMIGLIPLILDDSILTGVYALITIIAQYIYHEKHDILIYVGGFIFMLISETLFISTGVETFLRASLFVIMPLWLPFLWAYGFIVIRRIARIIES